MKIRIFLFFLLGLSGIILAACGALNPPPVPTITPVATSIADTTNTGHTPTPNPAPVDPPPLPVDLSTVGIIPTPQYSDLILASFTNVSLEGNHFLSGTTNLVGKSPIGLDLAGTPAWVLGAPTNTGSFWIAVLEDGTVHAFQEINGTMSQIRFTPEKLPAGMPPVLVMNKGVPQLLTAPLDTASQFSSPVLLGKPSRLAFVDGNGDLVIWENGEIARLPVNALPDARLLVDEYRRILLLAGATTIYGHGALGDLVEASQVVLVQTEPQVLVVETIPFPSDTVVEGLAPIWADLNGDGFREIILTVSTQEQGSAFQVYNEAGEQLAAGQPVGERFRWRHPLVVLPPDPAFMDKGAGLVGVLTPHLEGQAELYRLVGRELILDGQLAGVSSHVYGSRNLDMALGGDFDGDHRMEVLIPDAGYQELWAVQWNGSAFIQLWSFPLGGTLATNLAAYLTLDGEIALGVGLKDGTLKLWLP